ncbi:MAG: hypothetical protein C0404_10550 [Verrucomicrobia bacterium]|nr:hypothetical protein [Verrucomicrobiota bacterium]
MMCLAAARGCVELPVLLKMKFVRDKFQQIRYLSLQFVCGVGRDGGRHGEQGNGISGRRDRDDGFRSGYFFVFPKSGRA